MKIRRFYQGLKGKLILFFLLVGIIPLSIAAVIAGLLSSDALEKEAYVKLAAIHDIKTKQVLQYFTERQGDVIVLADNLTTRQAIDDFEKAFEKIGAKKELLTEEKVKSTDKTTKLKKSLSASKLSKAEKFQYIKNLYINQNPYQKKKEKYDFAKDGSQYSAMHKKYHPMFLKYMREYGYDDIFLIANDGDILYTVFKEADFATNVLTGQYKDENIAHAFKQVNGKTQGTVYLEDFKAYAPSSGKPASFIATPIYNQGKNLGVLVFQIPIKQINEMMANVGDDEKKTTLDAYLLGNDKFMRNNSRLSKGDKIDILQTKVATKPVNQAFTGTEVQGVFKDYRNKNVLGMYKKIKLLNLEWLNVVEVDEEEAFGAVRKIVLYLVFTGIIIGVIIAFAGFLIGNSIAKPIIKGVGFAQGIAQRNLTQTLDIKIKNDEVGEQANALIEMNDNLKDVLNEILEVSTTLAASSEEINSSATSLSEGAQTQASNVEETSASTEELASSIRQVSNSAEAMQDKSNTSLEEAQAYKENMRLISEEMTNISSSTEKIGDIVKVITDIADQTNLLALNAAIEAARAGEHGRGFAVVADAISLLANRSAESTKEIELLIKESVERINSGVSSVQKSNESFSTIISTIEENNNAVLEITKAVEDQRQGSDQIQKATEEINTITQSVSASAEEMAGSTNELQNLAERLNAIVGTFKISDNGGGSHQSVTLSKRLEYDAAKTEIDVSTK